MIELSSDTLHASCVSIDGRAVLLAGRSGSGKSDLALRLIDRGAMLVSDDYTQVRRQAGRLIATPPLQIAGKIEVRGVGIVEMPHLSEIPIALYVDLEGTVERLPNPASRRIAGVELPVVAATAFENSAPIKIELLLRTLPA
jgi:serine kinase of HPr protein (carbohydrate metabolism regulator)